MRHFFFELLFQKPSTFLWHDFNYLSYNVCVVASTWYTKYYEIFWIEISGAILQVLAT